MDSGAVRERLSHARLMLLFTPELCGGRDPLEVLAACIDDVDVVQVRVKGAGVSPARELMEWTDRALAVTEDRALVLVNDRVDVCASMLERGVAGVHLGADDTPIREARELLGPDALLGLSTHSADDVARSISLPLDYLGFGPIHATTTKGYPRGLGPERAFVAKEASPVPVFPIGGINAANADQLDQVGRACVGAGILAADDPAAAARAILTLLTRGS